MKFMGNVMAYIAATLLLVFTWVELVPAGFLADLGQPAHLAALGGVVGLFALLAVALLPTSRAWMNLLVAQVLASMPLFYLWGAWLHGSSLQVLEEVAGLLLFGALAWYGWRHKPVLLGLGVVAHGLLWDSWHVHHGTVMPEWYPLACGLYDVAFGLLAMMHHCAGALRARPPEPPTGLGRPVRQVAG